MAPSNRLKLLNFEIKELKHVHELSNKNGWEKGPQCLSFLDVEPRIRIKGCTEARLFTFFSRLAQAEKRTKTKGL